MLATDNAYAVIGLGTHPKIFAIFMLEEEAFEYSSKKGFACGVFPCEGAVSFSLATKHRIDANKADPEKVKFFDDRKV